MTYKLDLRKAIVYANTVRAICGKLTMIRKQRKELFKLSLAQLQHEEIFCNLVENIKAQTDTT